MIPAKTLPTKIRVLWFSASILLSLWYLYWIFYDVFVWDKVLTQVRPVNYVGLGLSIALTILGTQLEKAGISEKLMLIVHMVRKKPRTQNTQFQKIQQVAEEKRLKSIVQAPQVQPAKDLETVMLEETRIPQGCKFYLGYLYRRPKSEGIPDKCLMCEHVVNCFSPTAREIEQGSVNP